MPFSFTRFKEDLTDIYNSFQESILDRISSPFALSFVASWCIHNWRLVYAFFNFDSDCNLDCRYNIISTYAKEAGWCKLFWDPLLWSAIAVVSFLFLNGIYSALFLIYRRWFMPAIYKTIDEKTLVVDKKEYDKQVKVSLKYNSMSNDLMASEKGTIEKHGLIEKELAQLRITFDKTEEKCNRVTEENIILREQNPVPIESLEGLLKTGKWSIHNFVFPDKVLKPTLIDFSKMDLDMRIDKKARCLVFKMKDEKGDTTWYISPHTSDHIFGYSLRFSATNKPAPGFIKDTEAFYLTRVGELA